MQKLAFVKFNRPFDTRFFLDCLPKESFVTGRRRSRTKVHNLVRNQIVAISDRKSGKCAGRDTNLGLAEPVGCERRRPGALGRSRRSDNEPECVIPKQVRQRRWEASIGAQRWPIGYQNWSPGRASPLRMWDCEKGLNPGRKHPVEDMNDMITTTQSLITLS